MDRKWTLYSKAPSKDMNGTMHAWEILILNTEGYTVAAVALYSWLAEGRNFGEFKDKDVQKDRTDDVSR